MATFILTWNPDAWTMDPGEEGGLIATTASGGVVDGRWSVGVRQGGIHSGDQAFLLRQHRERGIVSVGEFTSEVYQDTHWDGTGRDANYASVRWTKWLDVDERLPVELMRSQIPGVSWDRLQASGSTVSYKDARLLAQVWQNHIDSLGLPSIRLPEEVGPTETFIEGAATRITVNRYERDPAARTECLARWGWDCGVCGFNFEASYGTLGKDFIHVHHIKDLATLGSGYKIDPVTDLRPVCPNCHAMLHRERPAMTVEALRARLQGAATPSG
jgi:5-methylcytosine-specific restriction protein A